MLPNLRENILNQALVCYRASVGQDINTHHVVPCGNYGLHIEITGEETDYPVGYDLTIFDEDVAKVSNHGWIVSDFKSTANGHLITSTSYCLKRMSVRRRDWVEKGSKRTSGRKEFRSSDME